ncbi:dentin sialophosphoprotein isoform X2 [Toxotes jaculatrix]|uniref:dentin sialophosphoprotein isoform X2 n=1 Tax=Toxotes jaculatrix TaxID=941984 RepID=UPI001B3B1663|nr:dentin sialophosphoprotein isoform X2 [Toxotes jaculatrix]
MSRGRSVTCKLCQQSGETESTGALSSKDQVTAHQNCLLFSSGIFCRNSPEFDDLFGFAVEDVLGEIKRGSKLTCYRCKRKGATAGCEVQRCKKSYHYPCAVQEGAQTIEDPENGNYGLYCSKHYQQQQKRRNDGSVNRLNSSKSSKTAGSSQRDANDNSMEAGPSFYHSDTNSSSSATHQTSKRRLSFSEKQKESPSKRKVMVSRISDDSSNSDDNEPNPDMEIYPLVESGLEESGNSAPEQPLTRKDNERQTESASARQQEDRSSCRNRDEDETQIDLVAESESLLLPVKISTEAQSRSETSSAPSPQKISTQSPKVILVKAEEDRREDEGSVPEQNPVHRPDQHTTGPSVPQQSSAGIPPGPDHNKPHRVTDSPPCISLAISASPPETTAVSLISSSSSSPVAPPSDPELSIDSSSFWRSCNAAGCTQAIFNDFINDMNDISHRIQSDQASQEDYDFALTVMAASGKLADLVAKQQNELQRKQMELKKAAAAMTEVISALRR